MGSWSTKGMGACCIAKIMLMMIIIDHKNIFEVLFVQSAVSWRSYDKQYLWGLLYTFLIVDCLGT